MAEKEPPKWKALKETVEFKTKVLNVLETTAKVGKPVAEIIAFTGAALGLFRILRGDRQGALKSGGATLIAVAASKGLENFAESCSVAIEKWEDTLTN